MNRKAQQIFKNQTNPIASERIFRRQNLSPTHGREKDKNFSDDSFHVAMLPVATFVQFLALMPVCRISQADPNHLVFKWKSLRTIFTLIYISYGVLVSTLFFKYIYGEGISEKNIGDCHENTLKRVILYTS